MWSSRTATKCTLKLGCLAKIHFSSFYFPDAQASFNMCPWEKVKFLTDWICTSLCVCVCYQRQGHLAFSRTMTSHSLISATPSSRVWEHTCLCCLQLHMCVFLCNCSLFGISLSVCHFSLIRVWIFWVYQQWVLKKWVYKGWLNVLSSCKFLRFVWVFECASVRVCDTVCHIIFAQRADRVK